MVDKYILHIIHKELLKIFLHYKNRKKNHFNVTLVVKLTKIISCSNLILQI